MVALAKTADARSDATVDAVVAEGTPIVAIASDASVEPRDAGHKADKRESEEQRLRKRQPRRPERVPTTRPVTPAIPERPERDLRAERDKPAATAKIGHYSVDSRPYATISIDGTVLGETPIYRVPLAAGTHHVRAVRQDGTSMTFSITIAAGKEVSSGRLKW
jgi:hypothetical protein